MAQPFHAGGAATQPFSLAQATSYPHHPSALSAFVNAATAYVPALAAAAAPLDHPRALGALLALAGVLPALWRLAHAAARDAAAGVRTFFIAAVTIPGRDPLNRHVVLWLLAHVVAPRGRTRFFTARMATGRGGGGAGDIDAAAAAPGGPRRTVWSRSSCGGGRGVQYLPHFEGLWFVHAGHVFTAHRSMESFSAALCDPGYDGVGGEELRISCLGRSVAPVRALLETCRAWAERQTQYFVVVYARDRYGISWQPKSRKPIRRLETVHFDEEAKRGLLADISKYLDPETQRRYQSRSMPYRRGYLFHGPPGTGKSSLSTALAGEFGLDLYEVKIPSVASDADLEQMFQEIPPQCIVLLEDIDAVWAADRGRPDRDDGPAGPGSGPGSRSPRSNCTLSGLLNVLDGVGSQEGRIVIMTTNKPERLDSALVRPGRVDLKVRLGYISRRSAADMFMRMFVSDEGARGVEDDDTDLATLRGMASAFAAHIPEETFTPSQLQGFFQLHLDSAAEAATHVEAWVAEELAKASSDGDIEIVHRSGN